jgi:hypothetical protein
VHDEDLRAWLLERGGQILTPRELLDRLTWVEASRPGESRVPTARPSGMLRA